MFKIIKINIALNSSKIYIKNISLNKIRRTYIKIKQVKKYYPLSGNFEDSNKKDKKLCFLSFIFLNYILNQFICLFCSFIV